MWFEMRREGPEFLARAPVVHVAEAEVPAARAQVFAALADARGWPHWFPNVRQAAYATPPPHGVGTVRAANVGGTHWVEEIVAWDEGRRWAWTVTRASVPFARAQVESFELTDVAGGTRVRWTLGLEPRLLARLSAPVTARAMQRLFRRAMSNLGTYLQREESNDGPS